MKFQFIAPEGPDYEAERMLRWEILRKPLGLPPGSELDPEDPKSLHLVAIDRKQIVGCVCFFPESKEAGRIFQMALSEEYQGKGFGRKLLYALEVALAEQGFVLAEVVARQESQGFYRKMGYHPDGDAQLRFGISFQRMCKTLLVKSEK